MNKQIETAIKQYLKGLIEYEQLEDYAKDLGISKLQLESFIMQVVAEKEKE